MEKTYKTEENPQISSKQISTAKKRYGQTTEVAHDLLEKLKGGDEAAYEKIYKKYVRPLFDFLSTVLHDEEEARNIVQDTFMYIWEKRGTLDFTRGIKGILYTYSQHRAFNHIRKCKRGEKYTSSPHHESGMEYAHDEVVIGDELSLMVEMTIDSMPAQRRKVFEMQRMEGKSNREIAKELGLSDATVSVHLKEARKDLEKIFRLIAFFLMI